MTASRLEEGVLATDVSSGNDSGATDKRSADVGDDGTVELISERSEEGAR